MSGELPTRKKTEPLSEKLGRMIREGFNLPISPTAFRHVILTCTYSGEAIPSQQFTRAIEEMIDDYDVQSEIVVTHTSPYFQIANKVSLHEVWMNMTDEDHKHLAERFPELRSAIKALVVKASPADNGKDDW